ncbi:DUF7109 family protein [Halorubrum vacuolatum]|uniref:Uncharacterized protein n=1 Tax=Halorubrum vacuolatum TaxID=63740 RepID=A0A238W4H9_HALVU|nr:hypothetical protein [Halorubrum vacuolatum]SNR41234.1 hypothetical protein SAMN06264855_10599 [Halorubrum vacuolatum]
MSDDGPSVLARDELAGVVERFGALTRSELSDALSELAFKRRTEVDPEAVDAAISLALAEYVLVPAPADAVREVTGESADGSGEDQAGSRHEDLLAIGPAAFPTPPPDVEDLPHILSIPDRRVDRDALAEATLDRFRDEVDAAVGTDDADAADRLTVLLEVSYDIEAWAAVDVSAVRERILAAIDG